MGGCGSGGSAGHELIEGWWFDPRLLQSACQSSLRRDTEPRVAPNALIWMWMCVVFLHLKNLNVEKSVCINVCVNCGVCVHPQDKWKDSFIFAIFPNVSVLIKAKKTLLEYLLISSRDSDWTQSNTKWLQDIYKVHSMWCQVASFLHKLSGNI